LDWPKGEDGPEICSRYGGDNDCQDGDSLEDKKRKERFVYLVPKENTWNHWIGCTVLPEHEQNGENPA